MFPGAADFAADAERGKARKEAGVGALLFEDDYPIRHWDHWLARGVGASSPRRSPTIRRRRSRRRGTSSRTSPRVTFEETGAGAGSDGAFLVAARHDASALPGIREDLVVFDLATGEARVLTPGDAWYDAPAVSPDGRAVAAIRTTFGSPDEASSVAPRPRRPRHRRAADARR